MEPPETEQIPVVVVAGPTAGGKTELALELADRFGGEVINADSVQVYRGLDVGTAKPTPAQRARVAHYLLDVADPDETYDAGRYAREARAAAARIRAKGRLPLLVGGTGLYVRAFLEGLVEGVGRDAALREQLEAEQRRGAGEGDPHRLHERLARVDPASARAIHPHDVRRTIRALELHALTGRPASTLREAHGFRERPFRPLYLVLDPGREALAARIDRRCEQMVEGGLLQEVRALREKGYGPELASMQAIGYRHMEPVLQGADTLRNVLGAMKHDTRQFARRQRTWFRKVQGARWVHPDEAGAIADAVEAFLAAG